MVVPGRVIDRGWRAGGSLGHWVVGSFVGPEGCGVCSRLQVDVEMCVVVYGVWCMVYGVCGGVSVEARYPR